MAGGRVSQRSEGVKNRTSRQFLARADGVFHRPVQRHREEDDDDTRINVSDTASADITLPSTTAPRSPQQPPIAISAVSWPQWTS